MSHRRQHPSLRRTAADGKPALKPGSSSSCQPLHQSDMVLSPAISPRSAGSTRSSASIQSLDCAQSPVSPQTAEQSHPFRARMLSVADMTHLDDPASLSAPSRNGSHTTDLVQHQLPPFSDMLACADRASELDSESSSSPATRGKKHALTLPIREGPEREGTRQKVSHQPGRQVPNGFGTSCFYEAQAQPVRTAGAERPDQPLCRTPGQSAPSRCAATLPGYPQAARTAGYPPGQGSLSNAPTAGPPAMGAVPLSGSQHAQYGLQLQTTMRHTQQRSYQAIEATATAVYPRNSLSYEATVAPQSALAPPAILPPQQLPAIQPPPAPALPRSQKYEPKRRGNLPKEAVAEFKRWYDEHSDCPYPTEEMKQYWVQSTGLSKDQVCNWFINARRRRGKELLEGGEAGCAPGAEHADGTASAASAAAAVATSNGHRYRRARASSSAASATTAPPAAMAATPAKRPLPWVEDGLPRGDAAVPPHGEWARGRDQLQPAQSHPRTYYHAPQLQPPPQHHRHPHGRHDSHDHQRYMNGADARNVTLPPMLLAPT